MKTKVSFLLTLGFVIGAVILGSVMPVKGQVAPEAAPPPEVAAPVAAAPQTPDAADAVTCADGRAPEILYQTSFEEEDNYDAGWTYAAAWMPGIDDPYAGWWSMGVDSHTSIDASLISPAVYIPRNSESVYLRFFQRESFDSFSDDGEFWCYDGGTLEVISSGTSFPVPGENILANPYDDEVRPSSNPLVDRDVWCNNYWKNDDEEYEETVVKLDEYAGKSVRLRFRFGTDDDDYSVWQIDDVSVLSCRDTTSPTVDPNYRRLAQKFLDEIRATQQFPTWQNAFLAQKATPFYRPDLDDVAYYEFPVRAPGTLRNTAAEDVPMGYIIVATGPHDYPISNWDYAGDTISATLDQLAAPKKVARHYRLDPIAFVGEDEDGNLVSQIAQLPGKIVGQTMDSLDKPPSTFSQSWIPEPTNPVTYPIAGRIVTTMTGPQPPVEFGEWGSWQNLKDEFKDSYAVVHEKLRRDAAEEWGIIEDRALVGVDIRKGETVDIDLLPGLYGQVVFSGEGAGSQYITTVVPDNGSGTVSITAIGAEPDRGLPLNVYINYYDNSTSPAELIAEEEFLFYIVDDDAPMPLQITNVAAQDSGPGQATITWQTDQVTDGAVTFGPQPGSKAHTVDESGSGTNHSVTLANLAPATTYYFEVTSRNDEAEARSAGHSFTTGGVAAVPAIENVQVINISSSAATVTWQTAIAANGRVEYGLASGDYPLTVAGGAGKTAHSVTLTGLQANTTYYFLVWSESDEASGGSDGHTFKTRPADENPDLRALFLPIITGDGPSAAALQGFSPPGRSADEAQDDLYNFEFAVSGFSWLSPSERVRMETPLYDQIEANTPPNTKNCWSGCTPTAWAMLIGWVDTQATTWIRWAEHNLIYRQNGGTTNVDEIAPLAEMNEGIRNVMWELHGNMNTICTENGEGSTLHKDGAGGMRAYLQHRTPAGVTHFQNSQAVVAGAITAIGDHGDAMVMGALSHEQLAIGYGTKKVGENNICTERHWLTRKCTHWNNRGIYETWFYVNTGWTSNHPDSPRFRFIRDGQVTNGGWLTP